MSVRPSFDIDGARVQTVAARCVSHVYRFLPWLCRAHVCVVATVLWILRDVPVCGPFPNCDVSFVCVAVCVFMAEQRRGCGGWLCDRVRCVNASSCPEACQAVGQAMFSLRVVFNINGPVSVCGLAGCVSFFLGCVVVGGECSSVVVATGMQTCVRKSSVWRALFWGRNPVTAFEPGTQQPHRRLLGSGLTF